MMSETKVCKYCGTVIEKKEIIETHFYLENVPYCPSCMQIEAGTSEAIYNAAKAYVDSSAFQYFPDMREDIRCLKKNYAKICEVLQEFYFDLSCNPDL